MVLIDILDFMVKLDNFWVDLFKNLNFLFKLWDQTVVEVNMISKFLLKDIELIMFLVQVLEKEFSLLLKIIVIVVDLIFKAV